MLNGKTREAAKHTVIYGIGSVAQSALGFVLLPILTTRLSQDDFGAYSLILMACTVASAVFYLGMTSALPRSYFDYPEGIERRTVFTTAFVILAAGALAQTLIGYLGSGAIVSLLLSRPEPDHAEAVAWAFLGGAITFINQYFFTYLRLLRLSIEAVSLSLTTLATGIAATIWLLDVRAGSIVAPFEAVVYSQLVITITFFIVNGRRAFAFRLHLKEMRPLVYFGSALVITSFGHMILDWADRIIIERFFTLADVGVYSAVVRVSGIVTVLLVVPFSQIWSPMMMEYREDKNIKQLFTTVFSCFLMVGGVIVAGATIFSSTILQQLIKYEMGVEVTAAFVILMLANLAYGTTNILIAGIFYERRVYVLPCIYYSIAVVKIALNVLMLPLVGVVGAALATLAASIAIPVCVYGFGKRYFRFEIEWARMGRLACIVGVFILLALTCAPGRFSNIILPINVGLFLVMVFLVYRICLSDHERRGLKSALPSLIK